MIHGQSVVIDCSYEEHMVWRETLNAAKQMTFVFGDNRVHKDPFNIHLCNVNLEGPFMKQLQKNIPSIEEPWFPLNIHTKSYLDVFPKEKLVYLTPHCREELTHFDHDAIYIIGCMVDKASQINILNQIYECSKSHIHFCFVFRSIMNLFLWLRLNGMELKWQSYL